jgi:hypothetical protein
MRSSNRAKHESDFKFNASGKGEIGNPDRAVFVFAAIAANPFRTNSAPQHPDTPHSKQR